MTRFLALKHYGAPALLAGIDLPETERLERVAAGREPWATRGDRVKALTALVMRDPPRAAAVLTGILADDSEDPDLRVVAATDLGRLPADLAEAPLLDLLAADDPALRRSAVAALGRVGGEAALAALQELGDEGTVAARRQRTLSLALIACRLGRDLDPLPFVAPRERRPSEGEPRLELGFQALGPDALEALLPRLEGGTYGIEVDATHGFEVTIGRAIWALLLERELSEAGLERALTARQRLAALLCRRVDETSSYAVQYLVFARPTVAGEVRLSVVRGDGEIVYTAVARIDGRTLAFEVSDVERAGTAPTFVRGRLGPAGLELDTVVLHARRREKRSPPPLEP